MAVNETLGITGFLVVVQDIPQEERRNYRGSGGNTSDDNMAMSEVAHSGA